MSEPTSADRETAWECIQGWEADDFYAPLIDVIAAALAAEREKARAQVLAIHRPMHSFCARCDGDRDVEVLGNNPDCPHYASYCHEDDFAWPCRTRCAAEADQ